jgi:hypothetical protein
LLATDGGGDGLPDALKFFVRIQGGECDTFWAGRHAVFNTPCTCFREARGRALLAPDADELCGGRSFFRVKVRRVVGMMG